MINVDVLSEDKKWSKKINKKEDFFNKLLKLFPKRYKFINKKVSLTLLLSNNKGVKKLNKVLFAYEPVWSIGTGVIPKASDLEKNVNFIRNSLIKKFRLKNPKILYGGSVNSKNVKNLKEINIIDGFLVGAASQDPKKFIDIVKKTFN